MKPRINPTLLRKGGFHQKSRKAKRKKAKDQLRQDAKNGGSSEQDGG